MATLADSLVSSSARSLALRMRPDLSVKKQTYQGRSFWVVKEPVGLKYYRFQEEEFAILKMLDGSTSLDEVKQRFEQHFAPQKITLSELQQFIGTLHRSLLVISENEGQGPQLKARRDERRKKEILQASTNVLWLRFKGIDPERLLKWMYPYLSWVFHPLTVMFCLLIAVSALTLVTVQFDVFRAKLPAFESFFSGPTNWLYLGIVLATTKVIHEFGHGLSCTHFGGECHEMGVMFLVFTPCLYCNVSDSWMLPNKWARAAIGAAGMYVEIVMASVATFLWWFSEPGLLNHLSLRVMFICSVSTVLFNGNPLLRFDGYYILSDIVEIPNLRQKASAILKRVLSQLCLGLEMREDPFLPQKNYAFFAAYTIAAVGYRWVVFLSILMFLNKVLEPYGLKIIGQALAMAGLFGLIVMPSIQLVKFFYTPGRMDQVKKLRLAASVAVVGAVIAAVVLIPVPQNVKCSLEIRPCNASSVFVEVPGRLDEVAVEAMNPVSAGMTLATLSNVDLKMTTVKLEGQRDSFKAQLKVLNWQCFDDPNALRQIPTVEEALESVNQQLKEAAEDERRLVLKSPIDGVVIPPASRPSRPHSDGQLPSWHGSPLAAKNLGVELVASDLFCQVGDPNNLEAILVIDQGDIEFVREKQDVKIKLEALPGKVFPSSIVEIAKLDLRISPASLSNQAGGDLATVTDATGSERPVSTSYQARALLDVDPAEKGLLRIGMRGRAKIFVGNRPLGRRIWRYLIQTFHFRL